jgi:hypothetical protein
VVQLHAFLTSAVDGGEWSASRPGRFIPRERAPGTQWIGSWLRSFDSKNLVGHDHLGDRQINTRRGIIWTELAGVNVLSEYGGRA